MTQRFPHAAPYRARVGGFTLIEMLVIVVIIGVLVAFVAPQINIARYRVESAMQGVGTTIVAAQRQAVTRQYDIVVMFDTAAASIHVLEDANDNGTRDAGEHETAYPLGDQIVFGRASATAGVIGSNPVSFAQQRDGFPAVTFHRNGSASEAGGFYVTSRREVLTGQNPEDTREAVIERSTGRLSWYRYGSGVWQRGF